MPKSWESGVCLKAAYGAPVIRFGLTQLIDAPTGGHLWAERNGQRKAVILG